METRANYILIGAFTLLSMLGALGLFLWLAKVEIDRQYAYYDILFEDVSGLGAAGMCATTVCRWARWSTCASTPKTRHACASGSR